jgi:hypothetical protein
MPNNNNTNNNPNAQGSTVLRVNNAYANANNNLVDWDDKAVVYGSSLIDSIVDEEAKKEITSIPSPFARIDLVNTAFREVNNYPDANGGIDGTTIYHKMVSDCLDIGELMFHYSRFSDKLELLVWDKKAEIIKLMTDGDSSHLIYGNSLNKYLAADAGTYHFGRMDYIYLLRYKGNFQKGSMDIIGATSPVTMFFSSANDLRYLSKDFQFGQDHPFDDNYQPLYKRDQEYQKYLYTFRITYGAQAFAKDFPNLNAYMMVTSYQKCAANFKTLVDGLPNNNLPSYESISINSPNGKFDVEILGQNYCMKHDDITSLTSDFSIQSTLCNDTLTPLVLPVEAGNSYQQFNYISSEWGKNNKAPYVDANSLDRRALPNDGRIYPYLTIGDFLRDEIVEMPFKLNSKAYFDGNYGDLNNEKSYLLPLTDTFFTYFSVDDLIKKKLSDGKPMIEIQNLAGDSVNVILRIPVAKGYIEYSRIYIGGDGAKADPKTNKGAIVIKEFGMSLMPDVSFAGNGIAHYIIGLFNGNGQSSMSLECLKENTTVKKEGPRQRRNNTNNCSVESYVIENDFDRIVLHFDNCTGAVIPLFKEQSHTIKYIFSVDLGTTNTHIEYKVDKSRVSSAFDIKPIECQNLRLHTNYAEKGNKDIDAAFEDSMVPDLIGEEEKYSFPTRTVLSERQDINYSTTNYAIADANIGFGYGKLQTITYNRNQSNLKWRTGTEAATRLDLFIENLCIMMRNKVVLGGGNLADTKIVWFYPASMIQSQYDRFSEVWGKHYQKYFGSVKDNIIPIPESVAPYYHFNFAKGATSRTLTIDIGGGTTDIYVVQDEKPSLISSFRFASNHLFGDGYNYDSDSNGFILKYLDRYGDLLKVNGMPVLKEVQTEIAKEKVSADIASFWFLLSSNADVRKINAGAVLDFIAKLKDDGKMKYPVIMFYSVIMYYIAHLMKAVGLKMPLTVGFSGNGSKTLQILSGNQDVLADYFKKIFEKVYGESYGAKDSFSLICDLDNPKLATCKGGIAHPVKNNYKDIGDINKSLLGIDDTSLTEDMKISEVTDELCDKIVTQAEKCIDEICMLNSDNHIFVKMFGADPSLEGRLAEICKNMLLEYTKAGVAERRDMTKSENPDSLDLEETMFFYPFVGMLNNLAREVAQMK